MAWVHACIYEFAASHKINIAPPSTVEEPSGEFNLMSILKCETSCGSLSLEIASSRSWSDCLRNWMTSTCRELCRSTFERNNSVSRSSHYAHDALLRAPKPEIIVYANADKEIVSGFCEWSMSCRYFKSHKFSINFYFDSSDQNQYAVACVVKWNEALFHILLCSLSDASDKEMK